MEHDHDKPDKARRLVYTPVKPEDTVLYELIMEAVNSGPPEELDLDELKAELDAIIREKE